MVIPMRAAALAALAPGMTCADHDDVIRVTRHRSTPINAGGSLTPRPSAATSPTQNRAKISSRSCSPARSPVIAAIASRTPMQIGGRQLQGFGPLQNQACTFQGLDRISQLACVPLVHHRNILGLEVSHNLGYLGFQGPVKFSYPGSGVGRRFDGPIAGSNRLPNR